MRRLIKQGMLDEWVLQQDRMWWRQPLLSITGADDSAGGGEPSSAQATDNAGSSDDGDDSTSAPAQPSADDTDKKQQRTFTQDQVNRILKKEKIALRQKVEENERKLSQISEQLDTLMKRLSGDATSDDSNLDDDLLPDMGTPPVAQPAPKSQKGSTSKKKEPDTDVEALSRQLAQMNKAFTTMMKRLEEEQQAREQQQRLARERERDNALLSALTEAGAVQPEVLLPYYRGLAVYDDATDRWRLKFASEDGDEELMSIKEGVAKTLSPAFRRPQTTQTGSGGTPPQSKITPTAAASEMQRLEQQIQQFEKEAQERPGQARDYAARVLALRTKLRELKQKQHV